MSYSETRDNLQVLVFTNSRGDYRVTVGAGTAPETETLVSDLARAIAPHVDSKFHDVVGLGPWPDDAARVMAFRVFNAGVYLGRPNTLAIVAIGVPLRASRSWSVASLLAASSVPLPGAMDYTLPSELSSGSFTEMGECYERLDRYDQQYAAHPPATTRAFGSDTPSADSVTGHSPDRSTGPRRRLWPLVILALVVLVAGGIGWWAWKSMPDDQQRKPGTQDASIAFDRVELQNVLLESGVISGNVQSRSASPPALAAIVVETAEGLKLRLDEMRDTLRPNNTPRNILLLLNNHIGAWKTPPNWRTLPLEEPQDVPDYELVAKAKDAHRRYQTIRALAEEATLRDANSDRFKEIIRKLRQALEVPEPLGG